MKERRGLFLGVLILGVLAAGRFVVPPPGAILGGPPLVVGHFFAVASVAGLLWICTALGVRLIHSWSPEDLDVLEEVLFGTLCGTGVVGSVLLIIGLSGFLSPATIFAVVAVAVVWSRRELAEIPTLVQCGLSRLPRSVLAVAITVGAVLLLRTVLPPTDWDSLMYHLELPRRFLHAGRIFVPEDNLHVAFVGLAHMLYLPALAFGGNAAPAVWSLGFALLLPLAVYRFAERAFGRCSGELSGVAIWGTATVVLVAATPRVDVTLAVFLLAGHYALYRACRGAGELPWLWLGGLTLGFAVGLKYQAGAYILALAPLVCWSAYRGERGRALRPQHLILFAIIMALVSLPWFTKNWMLLDAPFYPLFADPLLPSWFAEIFGTRFVPESVDGHTLDALLQVRRPFNILDAFLHPERLSVEREAAHYHMSPLLLLMPAWLLWIRDRDFVWTIIPGLTYVALILGFSARTNLRYLLPAVPVLTVAVGALVVACLRSVFARRLVELRGEGRPGQARESSGEWIPRAVGLVLVAISLVPTATALRAWLPEKASMGHLTGNQSRVEYLSRRGIPAMVMQAGLTDFGQRPVPEAAKILMLFDARGYYAPVPTIQDNNLTNWALLDAVRNRLDCLRSTDVSHVLVNTGVLDYYIRRGLDPKTVRWPAFLDFAQRCLRVTLEVPHFRLYRIREAGGSMGDK